MAKPPTDSGLPRNQARGDTLEGVSHPHLEQGIEVYHLHRLGNLPHDHGPDGNVIFKGSPQPITSDLAVPAPSPPGDGQEADPYPPAPGSHQPEPSMSSPAGSGGGSGRSIGRVIANTALDTALGVPPEVLDERAHAREAVEILVEGAAEWHRRNKPMPATMLLDLEGIVLHMVANQGLRQGSDS